MDIEVFLAMILPLVVYVVVDARYGMKAGIVSAVLGTVFLLGYLYLKLGELDEMILVEAAFLLVLSGVSLYLKNPRYFKFQPVVVGVAVAAYIFYLQWFSEPVLIKYIPVMVKLAPELAPLYQNERTYPILAQLSNLFGVLFFCHALLVAFAALKLKNIYWLLCRLSIYPMALLLSVYMQLQFMKGV